MLPAKDLKTGDELHKIKHERKETLLDKKVTAEFDGVLPFLPKVGDDHVWAADSKRKLGTVNRKGTAMADPPE